MVKIARYAVFKLARAILIHENDKQIDKGGSHPMWSQHWKQWQKNTSVSSLIKCGAVALFFLLSILVVSCGNSSAQFSPTNPVVTVTVNLGVVNGSPTPAFPDYACGGWATNTSPPYSPSTTVDVYAKFTHTVDGNPVGVAGASGTAIVLWPDGSTTTLSATTGSDGLAVFPVALKPIALNKIVLVQISFQKPGVPSCTIPQAAYFTAILASPTATATPSSTVSPSPTVPTGGTPTATPTGSPSPGPKPTKTPKPH
jgi:hypothetical protein